MASGAEPILFYIALIVVCAKVGGEIAVRFHQPTVLGEILIGILIGPSALRLLPDFNILTEAHHVVASGVGLDAFFSVNFAEVADVAILAALAEVGVLVLLFEVGLESNIKDFQRVGPSALLVALLGVGVSFAAGYFASVWFATQFGWTITPLAEMEPVYLHLFIGATLTATSVGITARVLGDLGKIRSSETQIILGAAVLDDILALIMLAVVGGLAAGAALMPIDIFILFITAFGFFVVAITVGTYVMPKTLEWITKRVKTHGVPFAFAFALMALLAYLATLSGLAAIVGAFAGGLVLSQSPHKHVIFDYLKPVGTIFIGFFFVTLGARVDLGAIISEGQVGVALLTGLVLTVAGVLGKLTCGFGVLRKGTSRLAVGVGMVPRGEVGLIFALIGLELGLLANWQYATVVLVVLLTTLMTPIWLKAIAGRIGKSEEIAGMPSLARTGELIEP